ncbi:MBOAT family protein, partial [Akkermansia muciniphila]
MNFISVAFILFLFCSVLIYYVLPAKAQWGWLLGCSIFFYLCYDVRYIFFLLFSCTTTFFAGKAIRKVSTKQKKIAILISTLIINLGLLLFIKYANYSLGLFSILAQKIGITLTFPYLNLLVPIGISFYTLQAVGYCIDVYRGTEPAQNFLKYFLFMIYFPQILQGPIPRFQALSSQLFETHRFNYRSIKFGLQLMMWGFFKKLVIADRAAILVNQVFDNVSGYAGFTLFFASLLYTLQIYTDFSGCVDIVRGASELFQIKLAQNFDQPYLATSIPEFWRRWHMSLSSWFRDYIYIPLGGNRKGLTRKCINVLIVFFVSGIWHGVGTHYIVWGFLHGVYQVIGMLWDKIKKGSFLHTIRPPTGIKILFTFNLVNFAWIFFRANTLSEAFLFLKNMFSIFNIWVVFDGSLLSLGLDRYDFYVLLLGIAVLIFIAFLQRKAPNGLREKIQS